MSPSNRSGAPFFSPKIRDRDTRARTGVITTRSGSLETPVFMPVGTAATVRGLSTRNLQAAGASIVLANTYHLFLRPGLEVIENFGSLHRFMDWPGPILTDSGGFQIFSLKDRARVSPEGVRFQSHIDGSRHFFTPEKMVDIQNSLDSDIQMVLDTFAPYPARREQDAEALAITLKWAQRARDRFSAGSSSNFQFGILQGGLFPDLRRQSLEALLDLDFAGYAIGGLSVGESRSEFESVVGELAPAMPGDKPRYLMGSGTPEEILFAVEHGVDMFDCVLPTRNARRGTLFTSRGKINIRNERFKRDKEPLDPDCRCEVCQRLSRAYLRHLHMAGEINAMVFNSQHNLFFYLDFLQKIRYSISQTKFPTFKKEFLTRYQEGV